jgi:hypothetical protein
MLCCLLPYSHLPSLVTLYYYTITVDVPLSTKPTTPVIRNTLLPYSTPLTTQTWAYRRLSWDASHLPCLLYLFVVHLFISHLPPLRYTTFAGGGQCRSMRALTLILPYRELISYIHIFIYYFISYYHVNGKYITTLYSTWNTCNFTKHSYNVHLLTILSNAARKSIRMAYFRRLAPTVAKTAYPHVFLSTVGTPRIKGVRGDL